MNLITNPFQLIALFTFFGIMYWLGAEIQRQRFLHKDEEYKLTDNIVQKQSEIIKHLLILQQLHKTKEELYQRLIKSYEKELRREHDELHQS